VTPVHFLRVVSHFLDVAVYTFQQDCMTPIHLLRVLIRVVHILGQLLHSTVHLLHSAIHSLEQLVSSLVPPLDDLLGSFVSLFNDLREFPSGHPPIPYGENRYNEPENGCSAEDICPDD
jgi:hypothetical protein